MANTYLRRIPRVVWSSVALFIVALTTAAFALLAWMEHEAGNEAKRRALHLANGAEAIINRTLLAVDTLVADLGDELRTVALTEDPGAVGQRLAKTVRRSLFLRDLMLVAQDGRVLAASRSQLLEMRSPLPAAFVKEVLAQPVPMLAISAPLFSEFSSERALFMARPITLADGRRALFVAEMPVGVVETVLAQAASARGLSVTFERSDGELLASAPHDEERLGQRLPLRPAAGSAEVVCAPARLGGAPSFMVVRPTLYRSSAVVVSMEIEQALAPYRSNRAAILAVTGLLAALALAGGAGTHWQMKRLALARRDAALAKEALDRALVAMDDGFLLCDANDRVVSWNRRYLDLFPHLQGVVAVGVPFEHCAEAGAVAALPEGDAAARAAWRERRLAQHRGQAAVTEIALPSGKVVHAVERRTLDGGIVGVFRDVTARERELERAKLAAEAANVAKSKFLAAMSHEMRTPLAGVLGMNRLLRGTTLDTRQLDYVRTIEASGSSLLALIDDILDLSRIEAGRVDLECADFDPRRLVDEALAAVRARAKEKGLALLVQVAPELPPALQGDARRLRQVLLNLLGNAIKFTEHGGVTVELTSRPLEAGRVELGVAIRDTGIGIPPEVLPKLFERFSQADAGVARRYGGSGLGLAISRELLTLMDGSITVDSHVGQGSTFRFALPLAVGRPALLPEMESTASAIPTPVQGGRVLVVEDNEVNQVVVRAMLEQLGFGCDIAADGRSALQRVQEREYALVLMDIQMPGMDGVAATRQIRGLPGTQARIPIVALTANAMPDERAEYLAAGMDGHVAKPVQVAELAEAIRRACDGERRAPIAA